MTATCKCGHDSAAHNGPYNYCQARCLCDSCPDGTLNDCWCGAFKPQVPPEQAPEATQTPQKPSTGVGYA